MNTPMWTATTRAQHKRDGLRFASDLTDAEWTVLEPASAASNWHWAAARVAPARNRQCDLLRPAWRHRVAATAALLPAAADGLRLVCGVAARPCVGGDHTSAGHA